VSIQLPKRLENSLTRIRKQGGIVLIHHTSEGSTDFQLQNGKSVAPATVERLRAVGMLIPSGDGLMEGCDQTLRVANA
jgi:hypothetical protein